MSTFDEMMKQFQDFASLKEFTSAQHETIMSLTRKIEKLEQEKRQLEQLLDGKIPKLLSEPSTNVITLPLVGNYDENICHMELKKLNDISVERQLTMEEAKKVEIYSKLLLQIESKEKKKIKDAKEVATDNLLELVKDENESR